MSRPQRSPMHWPAFPDIPIYLDTGNERVTAKTYGTTPTTPTTPEILIQGRLTHLSPAHINAPPVSPVEPSPTTTIETSRHRSVIWPIPEPPPEIVKQQQSRRPLLRFLPSERPRLRLDGLSKTIPEQFSGEKAEVKPGSMLGFGLGIRNGPPKPPSIRIQPPPAENEKTGSAPNIAIRIEEKLWRWSSSGNIIERWMLEIVSWLISAICMGAIIAVLVVLRDKSVTKWPFNDIGFTLNAFVSILSRIAGAALLLPVAEALGQLKWSWFIKGDSKKMWDFEMFDNASRGPWGAFLLLIHTRGKTVAALGALVTIFCLALDPFFQQVVSFPERWTLQNTTSSIPRVVRYEPQYPVEFVNGEQQTVYDQDIVAIADTFFLGNGTQLMPFGNGTRADIPLSCPTSRCTWPAYETLGMCSQCVETSQLLTFACMFTRVDWASDLNTTVSSYPNATVCGHFFNATSEEPVLMSGYMVDNDGNPVGETLLMRTLPLLTNPLREPLWGGSINFKDVRNPLVDVLISSTINRSQVYANETPVVHECVLSWCVQTIESSYLLGTYSENVTATFTNDTNTESPWHTEFDPSDGGTWIDYLENVTIGAPSTGQNFSEFGWGVNNLTMVNTIMVFDRMFPAFTTVADATSGSLLRWRTGSQTDVRTRQLGFNPWLLPNNITHHMERLVGAVSNAIRSSSSNEMIYGQVFDKETYVSVRWEWLSLPIGLLLVSFIFLLATVVKSATELDQVSIRKNSAIATLLYGLPDHYQKRLANSDSKRTPRAKAKELKVKLSPTRGWRVSGNVFSPVTPAIPRNLPPPGWI
ncbi:hypothetical protein EJ02DRAFT_396997 [Clathrospora elynae]|uniref:DUF3176 domain-containing protein n=1 Tax=Clathrospora elynae TaxID=706981 RepID=A0A6A5T2M6_9PLEO|nr:hypothetical protein EJ02DRAFT_396997 [Clathrospora elynae]